MGKKFGYTLLEILITLAIASVLFLIALPTWHHLYKTHQINLISRRLIQTLAFARQQAILRQQSVSICPSSDGKQCSDNWQQGWIIFITKNQQVLRFFAGVPQNIKLNWRGLKPAQKQLKIRPDGTMEGSNGSFYFAQYRLIISRGGRIRLEEITP